MLIETTPSQTPQRKIDHFLTSILLLNYWPQFITPNAVSWFRLLVLGPLILLFVFLEHYWGAMFLFLVAGLLDAVDGTLARIRNMISVTGAQLDALSDKIINVPLVVLLSLTCTRHYGITISVPIALLALLLTLVRFLNERRPARHYREAVQQVSATESGKWKMRCEVAGIALILIGLNFTSPTTRLLLCHIAATILGISILFALFSFADHVSKMLYPKI